MFWKVPPEAAACPGVMWNLLEATTRGHHSSQVLQDLPEAAAGPSTRVILRITGQETSRVTGRWEVSPLAKRRRPEDLGPNWPKKGQSPQPSGCTSPARCR